VDCDGHFLGRGGRVGHTNGERVETRVIHSAVVTAERPVGIGSPDDELLPIEGQSLAEVVRVEWVATLGQREQGPGFTLTLVQVNDARKRD
jgi:hypothetical protein